ncbi:MAG TPA: hypothetical protein VG963_07015 [Polyangiaceae bacterium]|nr:hypothetical protein [Polyangiaceae bacterium]
MLFAAADERVESAAVAFADLPVSYGPWRFAVLPNGADAVDVDQLTRVVRAILDGSLRLPRLSSHVEQGLLPFVAAPHGFNDLDHVLPGQLQLFNTKLGIVGDHNKHPVRTLVREPTSGQQFALDHEGDAYVPEPVLQETYIDDTGVERRRYQFVGEQAERAFFEKLRRNGVKFEVYERNVTPFLVAGALKRDTDFGGAKAMRATARIALNFLAHRFPDQARSTTLEPFKKWLLGLDDGDAHPHHASFGVPLAEGSLPPPCVTHGHRVVLAFDGHRALARVVFFDAYEVAVDMGLVDADMGTLVHAFDVDPLSEAPADVRAIPPESLKVRPADVGRMISDESHTPAIRERAGIKLNALISKAHEAEWDRRLTEVVTDLRDAARLEGERRHAAIVALVLKHCPQHATNLVLEAMRRFAVYLDQKGAHAYVVGAIKHLASPGRASASIQSPTDRLVQAVLSEISDELERDPAVEKAALRELLDGLAGLRIAMNLLFSAFREMPGVGPLLGSST